MSLPQEPKSDPLLRATQIAMRITVMLGIVAGLIIAYDAKEKIDLRFRTDRLAQIKAMSVFVTEQLEFGDQIGAFVRKVPPKCIYDNKCLESAEDLFERYGNNGERMYNAPELAEFRRIGNSFEVLGALTRMGYADFDFIFTVVFFPDAFWDATRPYRNRIQHDWKGPDAGKDKSLHDFWGNFSWLRDEYLKARRAHR